MNLKKSPTSFLYSNLKKSPAIGIFRKSTKKIEDSKDICDQISSILNNDCNSQNEPEKLPNKCFKKEENIELKIEEDNFSFKSDSSSIATELDQDKIAVYEKNDKALKSKQDPPLKTEVDSNKENRPLKFQLPEFKPFKFKKEERFQKINSKDRPRICPNDNLSEIPSLIQKIIEENNEIKLKENLIKTENDSLLIKNEILTNEINLLKNDKNIYESRNEELKNECFNLKKEIIKNECDKEKIENILNTIKKEITEIKSFKECERNKNKLLNEEKRELENKIITYEKNALLNYKKISELEEKIKLNNNFLGNLEIENHEYKNKINELNLKIEYLKNDLNLELNNKNDDLNKLKIEKDQEINKKYKIIQSAIAYDDSCSNTVNIINDVVLSIMNRINNINLFYEEVKERVNDSKRSNYKLKERIDLIYGNLNDKLFRFKDLIGKIVKKKGNSKTELIGLKDNLQEIYYFYLKEKTDFSYFIEDLQMRHRNEINNIRNLYSSQIKKIIKHYKGKSSDIKKLIPKDDDMWSVLK
ncbi:hypothetical protein H312_00295 [Anncaliia algerae PRA339]|uniref:Uncharacterized protein n=1 Tax=Anncaliia algerae PRA339 TaxID=1288291 RepID=A0A059F589_9MICR|nr:hypothetical protein H312_00295 [Anncaliia algerae PRA339]